MSQKTESNLQKSQVESDGTKKIDQEDTALKASTSLSSSSASSSSTLSSTDTNNNASTNVDVQEFLKTQLKENLRDRLFMLNIERDLMNFLKNEKHEYYKFPPMNPYYRMLVHRIGEYFGLVHNLDHSKQCVIVLKTEKTRSPLLSFQAIISSTGSSPSSGASSTSLTPNSSSPNLQALGVVEEGLVNEGKEQAQVQQKKQILKREVNDLDSAKNKLLSKKQNEFKPKTFEEKSAEYIRVKNRIFNNNTNVNSTTNGNTLDLEDELNTNSAALSQTHPSSQTTANTKQYTILNRKSNKVNNNDTENSSNQKTQLNGSSKANQNHQSNRCQSPVVNTHNQPQTQQQSHTAAPLPLGQAQQHQMPTHQINNIPQTFSYQNQPYKLVQQPVALPQTQHHAQIRPQYQAQIMPLQFNHAQSTIVQQNINQSTQQQQQQPVFILPHSASFTNPNLSSNSQPQQVQIPFYQPQYHVPDGSNNLQQHQNYHQQQQQQHQFFTQNQANQGNAQDQFGMPNPPINPINQFYSTSQPGIQNYQPYPIIANQVAGIMIPAQGMNLIQPQFNALNQQPSQFIAPMQTYSGQSVNVKQSNQHRPSPAKTTPPSFSNSNESSNRQNQNQNLNNVKKPAKMQPQVPQSQQSIQRSISTNQNFNKSSNTNSSQLKQGYQQAHPANTVNRSQTFNSNMYMLNQTPAAYFYTNQLQSNSKQQFNQQNQRVANQNRKFNQTAQTAQAQPNKQVKQIITKQNETTNKSHRIQVQAYNLKENLTKSMLNDLLKPFIKSIYFRSKQSDANGLDFETKQGDEDTNNNSIINENNVDVLIEFESLDKLDEAFRLFNLNQQEANDIVMLDGKTTETPFLLKSITIC